VILFLDFDGVLHPDPCRDREHLFESAPRLAQVVEAFPDLGVVLSTSWRLTHPFSDLLLPLPRELRNRVLGRTPAYGEFAAVPALAPYRRHAECLQWLREHELAEGPWFALDDRPAWFAPYCENLVECHPARGFDEAVAARLSSLLQMARARHARCVDLVLP
jgi:hypothetical protein